MNLVAPKEELKKNIKITVAHSLGTITLCVHNGTEFVGQQVMGWMDGIAFAELVMDEACAAQRATGVNYNRTGEL